MVGDRGLHVARRKRAGAKAVERDVQFAVFASNQRLLVGQRAKLTDLWVPHLDQKVVAVATTVDAPDKPRQLRPVPHCWIELECDRFRTRVPGVRHAADDGHIGGPKLQSAELKKKGAEQFGSKCALLC